MISRYSRSPMTEIWEEKNKFQKWLDVELAACAAHVQLGNLPEDVYHDIQTKARFDVNRIQEIEEEVQHDVIAFLTNLAEHIGPSSRFVHMGLTSSDVCDTAFSLLIQDSGKILQEDILQFKAILKEQAQKHKMTMMMGRTHGVHAEPMTLGLKLAVWYAEMDRNQKRLHRALETMRVGKISGPVGNYSQISPELEALVCKHLRLIPSPASTQILQRDRHAEFMTTLAIIAGTCEKIATEIRALQKTECNEIQEPFSEGQKGSSAMPHKKNPILCERVTGLARVIRGYAITALENQNLWHERDISHSSTERIIIPDGTILLDYLFSVLTRVIRDMVVNTEQMKLNLAKSNHVFYSQRVLLKLVDKGLLREKAYRVAQRNALRAFEEGKMFEDKLREDTEVTERLSEIDFKDIFNEDSYTRHIDAIFKRVFK